MDAIVGCCTAPLGGHRDRCSGCGNQPSPITRAATGTVPSASRTLATDSWPRAQASCCRCPTSTSSSRCRMSCQHSCYRTRSSYTICSSEPVAPRCSKWLATRSTLEPISVCSACSIPGGQNLQHHPHVHCVVPSGGLALNGTRWSRPHHASSCLSGFSAPPSAASSPPCSSSFCCTASPVPRLITITYPGLRFAELARARFRIRFSTNLNHAP
jgi:hypothetical protein